MRCMVAQLEREMLDFSAFLAILKKYLICQWFERMYLCGFVTLYVWTFLVGANKVEGTMS